MLRDNNRLHDVYLGLGANLGNKACNIHEAVGRIALSIGEVVAVSSIYETLPWGFASSNSFANAVCHVKTTFSPDQVLDLIQLIEQELGRNSKSKDEVYSDRLIDIDILLYDKLVVSSERLTIPHKYLHERLFALEPLSELAPDIEHPILGKQIIDLVVALREKS